MLIPHKGHTDTIQVYSVTVMTHVKALQAGHSSQGTSEPITPAWPFRADRTFRAKTPVSSGIPRSVLPDSRTHPARLSLASPSVWTHVTRPTPHSDRLHVSAPLLRTLGRYLFTAALDTTCGGTDMRIYTQNTPNSHYDIYSGIHMNLITINNASLSHNLNTSVHFKNARSTTPISRVTTGGRHQ